MHVHGVPFQSLCLFPFKPLSPYSGWSKIEIPKSRKNHDGFAAQFFLELTSLITAYDKIFCVQPRRGAYKLQALGG
jgi:hypothetical protein